MNERLFYKWIGRHSGITNKDEVNMTKQAFDKIANADEILKDLLERELSAAQLAAEIRSGNIVIQKQIEEEPVSQPMVMPVAPTLSKMPPPEPSFFEKMKEKLGKAKGKVARFKNEKIEEDKPVEEPVEKPKFSLSGIFSNKKMLIGIGVGLVILVVLVIFAINYFGSRPSETTNITFEVPTTVVENTAAEGSSDPVVPTESSTTVLENRAVPSEEESGAGFRMRAPTSIPDLFANPDWSFLIFVGVLVVMILLVKQERFAEQQQTDWRIILVGYFFVIAGMVLNDVLAINLTKLIPFLIGVDFLVTALGVQIVCLICALVFFISAAATGKTDWTPVSVGLFVIGGLLIAFNPEGAGRIVGYVTVFVGVAVHIYELTTEKGTAGALGMVLVGLPLFIAGRIGFEALFGLIKNANLSTAGDFGSQALLWLATGAYDYRVLWATILSLLIGFALSGVVAAMIFPPIASMLPQGGQTVGILSPTEDTPRIDAIVAFLMGVICFWLISGHF